MPKWPIFAYFDLNDPPIFAYFDLNDPFSTQIAHFLIFQSE